MSSHVVLSCVCFRSASHPLSTAVSSSTTVSRTVRFIITPAAGRCVLAVRNPSRAAASQPWARSFILSILSVPSASSSSIRAPSKSKTTSLTARAASSSSSARKMPDWLSVCVCVSLHIVLFACFVCARVFVNQVYVSDSRRPHMSLLVRLKRWCHDTCSQKPGCF